MCTKRQTINRISNAFTGCWPCFFIRGLSVTDKRKIEATGVRQASVVDGNSASRLLAVFNTLLYQKRSAVRKANEGDLVLLFHWANDPLTKVVVQFRTDFTWKSPGHGSIKKTLIQMFICIYLNSKTLCWSNQIRYFRKCRDYLCAGWALSRNGPGCWNCTKGDQEVSKRLGVYRTDHCIRKTWKYEFRNGFSKTWFNFVHDDKFDAEKYILNYERY